MENAGPSRRRLSAASPSEANARAARPRLVERGDDRFLVAGTPDSATLELGEQYFAERDAGRGPAQQMMDFAQPLIENSDGTADGFSKAMTMAMVFWNLAITREEAREEMMTAILSKDADPEVRSEFHVMAKLMIARHEAMFPELEARNEPPPDGPRAEAIREQGCQTGHPVSRILLLRRCRREGPKKWTNASVPPAVLRSRSVERGLLCVQQREVRAVCVRIGQLVRHARGGPRCWRGLLAAT